MGITPLTTISDVQCILLARLGQSVKSIERTTGLSAGRIQYRLKLSGIKLSDYRDGKSPIAERMVKMAMAEGQEQLNALKDAIRKQLGPTQ